MSSKPHILRLIREKNLAAAELPSLQQAWIRYDDRTRQFAEALQLVGGRCLFLESRSQLLEKLSEQPSFVAAKKIVSLVPEASGNIDLNSVEDPHALEEVDFAILPGEFGVAENGAVWTTDVGVKHRAIYFIVQHLVLVIDVAQIVDNMHDAYERLRISGQGYRAFISGPSKTADIEQSLVIGAHGPRSLTVACITSG